MCMSLLLKNLQISTMFPMGDRISIEQNLLGTDFTGTPALEPTKLFNPMLTVSLFCQYVCSGVLVITIH